MSVAERWEKERRNFSVLQWVDCFKQLKEEEQKKKETKVLTVLQLIEARIGWPANSARTIKKNYYKNTKQDELRQRMNVRYGSWGQHEVNR